MPIDEKFFTTNFKKILIVDDDPSTIEYLQTTLDLSAGGYWTTDSISYTIPSNWSGTYTARVAVWSGTPGTTTWLDHDDSNFIVKPPDIDFSDKGMEESGG